MRINRNIVECKYYGIWIPVLVYTELIETLWNVNTPACVIFCKRASELIETLWNVNLPLDIISQHKAI